MQFYAMIFSIKNTYYNKSSQHMCVCIDVIIEFLNKEIVMSLTVADYETM